jgi:hypothetical protein
VAKKLLKRLKLKLLLNKLHQPLSKLLLLLNKLHQPLTKPLLLLTKLHQSDH